MKTVKPMRWTTPTEETAWVAAQVAADRARYRSAMTPTLLELPAGPGGGITRQACGGGHRVIRIPARY